MDDPGSWCWLITFFCIILTAFFSSANLALRHISWTKIEEAFLQKKRPERTDIMRLRHFDLVCGTAVSRLLTNLVLLLVVIYIQSIFKLRKELKIMTFII